MVAENMHYRPTLGAVCRRVRAGDIGEPVQMIVQPGSPRAPEGWVADREKVGGGVFMDIGIHYIRSMRLLVGEPDQVMVFRAMQINTKMSGEDGLTAVFSSRHGWQCHMTTTWSTTFGITPDIMLLGDRGTSTCGRCAGISTTIRTRRGPSRRCSATCAHIHFRPG